MLLAQMSRMKVEVNCQAREVDVRCSSLMLDAKGGCGEDNTVEFKLLVNVYRGAV